MRGAVPSDSQRLPRLALLILMQGAVAAASLVVEIVAGRLLAPYLGMSLYTWTAVIAVVLAGFSVGHWAGGWIAERPAARALTATAWSMVGAAATTAAAVFVLRWSAGFLLPAIADPLTAITLLTALVFFLPSFFAGIPAPVLAKVAVAVRPQQAGRALGAIFAAGALGAIAGTLLAGFLFISWLGSTGTLATVTLVYLGLAVLAFIAAGSARRPGSVITAGLGLLIPATLAGFGLARPDPCTEESDYFCIRVLDVSADAGETARLMVLDHLGHGIVVKDSPQRMLTPHASILDSLARARMAGRDFDAFFIGGGSYSIPRAWAASLSGRSRVTVAEIDPAVTAAAVRDFWFDPTTAQIIHDDARRVLRLDPKPYDVIVGDAFTDIAVPAHLVTREFFELVADRLTPDGVYLMNVIDFAGRLDALAAVVETLRQVFPTVEVWAELARPEPDARLVFIVLATQSPSAFAQLLSPAPDRLRSGRLSAAAVDALIVRRQPPILTDDYAPIERLLGRLD
ncbi:MAG: fused MFS/spermidine synthase [Kiloniellaceae bacterium]